MQIQIKCSCGKSNCPEWAIIELQGVVEAQPSIGDRLQNLEMGRLCCTSEVTYTFTVGYHELSGTKMPLKKPLLVLRKRKLMLLDGGHGSVCVDDARSETTELEVVGIIRQRILFKSRPKALISKPQVKEGKPVIKLCQ